MVGWQVGEFGRRRERKCFSSEQVVGYKKAEGKSVLLQVEAAAMPVYRTECSKESA